MNRNSPWRERRKVVLPGFALFGMVLGAVLFHLPELSISHARKTSEVFLFNGQERVDQNTIRITGDYGGPLLKRMRQISTFEDQDFEIRVLGVCASACTLYLGQPNICTSPNAGWMFHPIQSRTGIPRSLDPFLARLASLQLGYYPPGMRDWIRDIGQNMDPDSSYWISGRDLAEAGWIDVCPGFREARDLTEIFKDLNEGMSRPSPLPKRGA